HHRAWTIHREASGISGTGEVPSETGKSVARIGGCRNQDGAAVKESTCRTNGAARAGGCREEILGLEIGGVCYRRRRRRKCARIGRYAVRPSSKQVLGAG